MFETKLYRALGLIFLVVCLGVFGYQYFSGYSWVNALYMTVITISTVGFGEVTPLNDSAKIFTVFLILTSIGAYAYAISVITEYITNGRIFEEYKYRKVQHKISKLDKHVIICGYGRNGKEAAERLAVHKEKFVVIEKDDRLVQKAEHNGILCVTGDATEDSILQKAGLNHAAYLITTLPSDADNLFVVLTVRQLNPALTIISRASTESSVAKLKSAGADNIIMPDKLGGEHMASLVVTPDIIEFMDNLSLGHNFSAHIKEITVGTFPLGSTSKTIRDLDMRKKTGCTVIGFKTAEGDYIVNPEADTKLTAQSKLIVLGKPQQLEQLNTWLKTKT